MTAHEPREPFWNRLFGRKRVDPAERRRGPHFNVERLEERQVMAAQPIAGMVGMPSDPLIGEQVSLTVQFDNGAAGDVGYQPYVDLLFPATGADGDDGLSYLAGSANFLGTSVTETILTFDESGTVLHPYAVDDTGAPVEVHGTAGDQLVVLLLPYGSFTPEQPPVQVTFDAQISSLADVGEPLNLQVRGGFALGETPLDDAATDPSVIGDFTSYGLTPSLFRVNTEYLGPENETATGANFVQGYRVTIDVAAGQTLTNVEIQTLLDANLAFQGMQTITAGGYVVSSPTAGVAHNAPDNVLRVLYPTLTGTTADVDAEFIFEFFAPEYDANNVSVLSPTTGDDVVANLNVRGEASWIPTDVRDALDAGVIVVDPVGPEHVLGLKSVALQESVNIVVDTGAAGATPGDILEYALRFQISDFYSFNHLKLTELLSDGQRLSDGFTPTFDLWHAGVHYVGTFNADSVASFSSPLPDDLLVDLSQLGFDSDPATDGSTRLVFNLEQALQNAGGSGILQGGTAAGEFGPTTGTIRFQAEIQDTFTDTYPSGAPRLDENDPLSSSSTIEGTILDNATLVPTGYTEADDSHAGLRLAAGTFSKEVYAVNGVVGAPAIIAPGDTITYRLRYYLTSGDFEQFALTDYLPMPIFRAGDPDADGTGGPAWSYDLGGSSVPGSGMFQRGPNDTQFIRSGIVPTLVVDAANNALRFEYGTFEDGTNQPAVIDLLFTVTMTDDPFADQLFLTSHARQQSQNTQSALYVNDNVAQVLVTEPVVNITKGVVATNNPNGVYDLPQVGPVTINAPGSAGTRWTGTIYSGDSTHTGGLLTNPLDANLRRVDAGDVVTFAIVVENTGSSRHGAFDVSLRDVLPTGFEIPPSGLNLRVTDGTGATKSYVLLGDGLFDPAGGLQLVDSDSSGALGQFDPTSGKNLVVITFDLRAIDSVEPKSVHTNTAVLFNFAGSEGGPDHTSSDRFDTASVTIAAPTLLKELVGTEFVYPGNSNTQAVIGELVTYRVTITIPEGFTPGTQLIDTLDAGLAFVEFVGYSSSNPSDVAVAGSWLPTISNGGRTLTWGLGDITNANRNNAVPETLTFEYRVVVTNEASNQEWTQLRNTVQLTWTDNATSPVTSAPVTVIEPLLDVQKTAVVNNDVAPGDAGDPVVYTITIRQHATNRPNAYDVTFSDVIPTSGSGSLILNPTFTITDSAGELTADNFELVGSNAAGWTLRTKPGFTFDFLQTNPAREIRITVAGTLPQYVNPAQTITNNAEVRWSSLDGEPGVRSSYNPNAVERTGAGGVNDYVDRGTARFNVADFVSTKSIVSTSEGHTTNVAGIEQVAVGEVVRYRLAVRVPEGNTANLRITDLLPDGLRFLNDGTVRVTFVSNDGGLTSSSLSGVGLNQTGNSGTLTPTFTLPAGAISGAPYNDGSDVGFFLGNIVNQDRDADGEYVIIEFNALVDNVSTSQAFNNATGAATPTTLVNTFQTKQGSGRTQLSNEVPIQIVEPVINNLTKNVTAPPSLDAGDEFQYTLTFSNTATSGTGAAAFDVNLLDQLDAYLELVSLSVSAGGATVTDSSTYGVGGLVRLAFDRLEPGQTVTVTVHARVQPNVSAGQTILASAHLTYSGLAGNGAATPGASGSATGERNGTSGVGGLNDYVADSNTVAITLAAPTVDKSVHGANTAAVGGLVYYDLIVDMPEGTSQQVVVVDDLPAGLQLISYQIITNAASSGGALTANFAGILPVPGVTQVTGSGGEIAWNFGTIVTTADNQKGNDRFLIRVTAQVVNEAGNQNGVELVNEAHLTYENPNTHELETLLDPTPAVITVTEPDLSNLAKSVSGATGSATAYQLTFSNTGTATAYDVVLSDLIPPGMQLQMASIQVSTTGGVVGVNTAASVADQLRVTLGQVPVGATVTISYVTTVITPGTSATNVVDLDYRSQPTAVTEGRNGSGGPLNDYFAQDEVTVGAVGDFVWNDLNGNGVQDGEPGLAGVVVHLRGAGSNGVLGDSDDLVLSTVTGADGRFFFTGLPEGAYQLRVDPFTLPEDAEPTYDLDHGTDNPTGVAHVTIDGSQWIHLEADFGFQIIDDGIPEDPQDPDPEPEIPTPEVPTPETPAPAAPGEPDLWGFFPGDDETPSIPQGVDYGAGVRRDDPQDYRQDGTAHRPTDYYLANGALGNGEQLFAGLSGSVFLDANNNGIQDANEAGLPYVLVQLDGPVTRFAWTDAGGFYHFDLLPPGTYSLHEAQPEGLIDGKQQVGTAGGSTGPNSFTAIGLQAGMKAWDYQFAELLPASLGGLVYLDANHDGIQQDEELGLPGMPVHLTGVDDHGARVSLTGRTGWDGSFRFDTLRPGDYTLTQAEGVILRNGTQRPGTLGGQASGDLVSQIVVTPGVYGDGYHFAKDGLQLEKTMISSDWLAQGLTLAYKQLRPGIEATARSLQTGGDAVLRRAALDVPRGDVIRPEAQPAPTAPEATTETAPASGASVTQLGLIAGTIVALGTAGVRRRRQQEQSAQPWDRALNDWLQNR